MPEAAHHIDRWNLVVVIPARDEERSVAAAVASVGAAVDRAAAVLGECRIVVVADSCSDATAARARGASAAREDTSVLAVALGNVGAARAAGVTYGTERLRQRSPQRTWIANTDADTVVPNDWVVRQLRWAERGWAAVAGVVDVDDFEGQPSVVPLRFRATYTDLLPLDGSDHPHVHGANLGVRLDAYGAVGGWAPLECSEDHDLWNRLRAHGFPLVSPVEVTVTTSGRAAARCTGGFADALRQHAC